MICNNKGPDQPAHPRSIISNFVVCFWRRIIRRLASCEKKINFLSSLFSRDSHFRKPRRQVFSRHGLCCLLDSSRTNTSNATDNNIKNIYNEEDILHVTGIAVFDCTLHRLRNYGPQSRGTAGALIFWLQVSGMTTSADPEGVQGVRTPLENHKLYGFL